MRFSSIILLDLSIVVRELDFEVQRRIFGFFRIKMGQAPDGHQNVSKTKVDSNVTPRGRSEVFSASTRSKKY